MLHLGDFGNDSSGSLFFFFFESVYPFRVVLGSRRRMSVLLGLLGLDHQSSCEGKMHLCTPLQEGSVGLR
jgi:hypothetical protein